MKENDLSYLIRGAIFKVYQKLGPGLLESVYEAALKHELLKLDLEVKSQFPVPVNYDGVQLELGFRIDLIVNNKVIIEIKSVEEISPVHYKQLLTYLKLTDTKLGLLVNFNSEKIENSIRRIVNNLEYEK